MNQERTEFKLKMRERLCKWTGTYGVVCMQLAGSVHSWHVRQAADAVGHTLQWSLVGLSDQSLM